MSSYAKTFGRIFAEIFGTVPSKPRLRREQILGKPVWLCSSADNRAGVGPTPETAYEDWRKAEPAEFTPREVLRRAETVSLFREMRQAGR